MARPLHEWNNVSATGYDISNAFGLAMQGINTAAAAADNWIKTKSEIETGKTMNALALAQDESELREIMGAVSQNSWADQTALANASKTIQNRMFDENITTQELEEKLIAGAHARKMAEGNLAVSQMNAGTSAMNAQTNRMTANKNIEVQDYNLGISKRQNDWMFKPEDQWDDVDKLNSIAYGDAVTKGTLANEASIADIQSKRNKNKLDELEYNAYRNDLAKGLTNTASLQEWRAERKAKEKVIADNAKEANKLKDISDVSKNSAEVNKLVRDYSKGIETTLATVSDPLMRDDMVNQFQEPLLALPGVDPSSVLNLTEQTKNEVSLKLEKADKATKAIMDIASNQLPLQFSRPNIAHGNRVLQDAYPLVAAVVMSEDMEAKGINGQRVASAIARMGAGGSDKADKELLSYVAREFAQQSPQAKAVYDAAMSKGKTKRTFSIKNPYGENEKVAIPVIWSSSNLVSLIQEMTGIVGVKNVGKQYGQTDIKTGK